MNAISKARFQQFLRQAKGVQLNEIHVRRQNKKKFVTLQYNGRTLKGKGRMAGEWQIPNDAEETVTENINAFLAQARKHFFVKRGEGLEGDVYSDAAMDKKVVPIVAESSAESSDS